MHSHLACVWETGRCSSSRPTFYSGSYFASASRVGVKSETVHVANSFANQHEPFPRGIPSGGSWNSSRERDRHWVTFSWPGGISVGNSENSRVRNVGSFATTWTEYSASRGLTRVSCHEHDLTCNVSVFSGDFVRWFGCRNCWPTAICVHWLVLSISMTNVSKNKIDPVAWLFLTESRISSLPFIRRLARSLGKLWII